MGGIFMSDFSTGDRVRYVSDEGGGDGMITAVPNAQHYTVTDKIGGFWPADARELTLIARAAAAPRFQLQITDGAYTVVPDRAWKCQSTHRSVPHLRRQYRRWHRWFHPQQNAWSGHVRVVDEAGRCVEFDGHDLIVTEFEGEWLEETS
jgi:hypothetical protein